MERAQATGVFGGSREPQQNVAVDLYLFTRSRPLHFDDDVRSIVAEPDGLAPQLAANGSISNSANASSGPLPHSSRKSCNFPGSAGAGRCLQLPRDSTRGAGKISARVERICPSLTKVTPERLSICTRALKQTRAIQGRGAAPVLNQNSNNNHAKEITAISAHP